MAEHRESPTVGDRPPNIILIMTDQHRYDRLSCVSGGIPHTPSIDRLAREGTLFGNAYTPSPVCAPARAAIKTGMYPPGCGVVGNWVPFKRDVPLLTERLGALGYQTALSGKLHFVPHLGSFGFDWRALHDAPYSIYAYDDAFSSYVRWLREHWHGDGDPVLLFDEDESAFKADDWYRFIMGGAFRTDDEHDVSWTTREAIRFLKERDTDKPFFLFLSYFGPHQPFDPPEPWRSMYDPADVDLPTQFHADMSENPVFQATCGGRSKLFRAMFDEAAYRRMVAAYCGQVSMIDENIGRLFTRLEAENEWDRTLVIFTADHGDHNGAYGLFFKGQMYDSCCKVPLLIKAPEGQAGGHRDQVVSTLDLYGTILDYAGDREWRSPGIEARSLSPLLARGDVPWENVARSIIGADPAGALTMLRRDDIKLTRLARGDAAPLYELYDMGDDPVEVEDLYAALSAEEPSLKALKEELDAWTCTQVARYPDPVISYVRHDI